MKKRIYLTDLDGTLTKGSLVLEHCGFLIEQGIIEDDGSYTSWVDDKKNEKLIVAVAENYRFQLIGKRVEDLKVHEFVRGYLSNKDNFYQALEYLAKEKKAYNSRVVIITGSSDFLVKEFASELGFECQGTKYLKDDNGRLTGDIIPMFHEQAKSDYIQENIDICKYQSIGLGDTASDIGIFKNCDINILVDPSQETLEKIMLSKVQIDKIIKE